MDSLMFKELVKTRVIPVMSIMAGSIFLASCSSGVSRFDFPMFGLSSSEESGSTASIPREPTIAPSANDLTQYSGGDRLAEFGNDRSASSVVGSSTSYNTRTSYLPPQTAAPEVRSARYDAVEGASARQNDANPTALPVTVGARGAGRYDAKPMRPIGEAQRSFLPSEPRGYDYNSGPSIKARTVTNNRKNTGAAKAPARTVNTAVNGASSVTVAPGDTLYSLGRRYNVSVVEIMETNQLADSNLTVGQQLTIPGGSGFSVKRSQSAGIRPSSSGTYTVRPGETFQKIAAKHGVSSAALADLNGITDPGSLRAGEVLILPKSTARKPVRANGLKKLANVSRRSPAELKVRKVKTQSIKLGSSQNKSQTVAKKQQSVEMKRKPRSKVVQSAFRWPVRGRIIGKFGPRTDGTHNDGINLAVPNGTKVKAAEEGVVAYAGSELEGYGNLVLIRHSNDWVSAYAHNDKLMVKRGQKIKRGQVIARAGTSGSVEVPQVHFELRKGSKPVDPTKYMAGT